MLPVRSPKHPTPMPPRIGTAGWSIPRALTASFPTEGTHLERYARVLNCAEINSTFYRPSRPSTYAKWASQTPDDFLFSLKAPKTITHTGTLDPAPIKDFLTQTSALVEKRGPILFQLPPKKAFDPTSTHAFLTILRDLYEGPAVFEPRHATWFTPEADALLRDFHIARAAADPPKAPSGDEPGGAPSPRYSRLHGSPRIYYSSYPDDYLAALSTAISTSPVEAWVIFDNTASGAAAENALTLKARLNP
jgi:uncharacterized protein YecE (DUF72 family)